MTGYCRDCGNTLCICAFGDEPARIDIDFGEDLCRFLGLDPHATTAVHVDCRVGEAPTIWVEGYVTEGDRPMPSAGRWRLVPDDTDPLPPPQEETP